MREMTDVPDMDERIMKQEVDMAWTCPFTRYTTRGFPVGGYRCQAHYDAGSFSANALRFLWKSGVRGIAVRKVGVGGPSELEDQLLSSDLNVGFLMRPGDLEFFTKVTFAISNKTSLSVELKEVYNLVADLPPKIQSLGTWTKEGQMNYREGFMDSEEVKPNRTSSTMHYVRRHFGNVEITGGYAGDVWHTLQDRLGFTYSCRQPPDGLWGNPTNGVWNGLVKELLDNNADVVVTALDNSNARVRVLDFLLGLKEIGYQLVVRRPGLMERTWTSFTSELVPAAWLATVAFALMVPPFLCFSSKFSPQETERISLKDAYILTIGAFTVQGSWLEVRSISTRIIFITIFFTTLLVYAHYTSALVSLLTVASTSTHITSLQSLLEDGTYSFGFQRDISVQSYFETSQGGLFHNVWKQLVLGNPSNLPTTDDAGITWVLDKKYVHMIEENLYRAKFSSACDTVMVRGKYFTQQTGFALQKGSPLQKIFNHQ
ncbi:glutamate receptor ionotropic, kainate 2-like [Macrobrachium nipponense]|uniref:glutamate receptor ionotropic, kainate 2-like n=1 Tax=Macrobrachium nipponense TaxID=159736 RepID=UPI0030C837DE